MQLFFPPNGVERGLKFKRSIFLFGLIINVMRAFKFFPFSLDNSLLLRITEVYITTKRYTNFFQCIFALQVLLNTKGFLDSGQVGNIMCCTNLLLKHVYLNEPP